MEIPHYMELQRRLLDIFRYVSCHEKNFDTYSVIIESALVDTGSFFDSLAQTFIRFQSQVGRIFTENAKVANFQGKINGANFNFGDYRTLLEPDLTISSYAVNLNPYEDALYYNPTMHAPHSVNGFFVQPFKEWAVDDPSPWWKAFTALKHDRIRNSKEAKLRHLIFALAAAFIILSLLRMEEFKRGLVPIEIYALFLPKYWGSSGRTFRGTINWS